MQTKAYLILEFDLYSSKMSTKPSKSVEKKTEVHFTSAELNKLMKDAKKWSEGGTHRIFQEIMYLVYMDVPLAKAVRMVTYSKTTFNRLYNYTSGLLNQYRDGKMTVFIDRVPSYNVNRYSLSPEQFEKIVNQ
jgi:hypothetical protein